jgi:hypothetical protein
MTRVHDITRAAAVAACLSVLVLLAPAAAPAGASVYGELTRFGQGAPSIGSNGQINDDERRFTHGETLRAHLIGVDPTDNSVYVLDEPEEASQALRKTTATKEAKEIKECKEEAQEEVENGERPEEESEQECKEEIFRAGPITRHFRIQKFAATGGEYHAVASVRFDEKAAETRSGGGTRLAVEGIAVDPVRKRLYVLAVDARKFGGVDEVSSEQFVGPTLSFDLPVASTLFAFSTEPSAGQLVPAGKNNEPILTGPGETELAPQSQTPGKALLEPAGITVDPENGDVIVLSHEDSGKEVKKFEDQLYDTSEVKSPDHFVLQRIAPTGEVIPGDAGRYVDAQDFFKRSEHPTERASPSSPVIVGAEHSEQVDVQYEDGIVRLPADFAANGAPEFSYAPSQQKGAAVGAINNSSAFHPVGRQAPLGGVIAASPFGAEGNTIFTPTKVENEQPSVGGFEYAGVGAIAAATGALQGWTGAQNIAAPRTGGEPPYACVLNPAGEESYAPVAAGSGGKVFVLAVEFIEKDMRERWAEGSSYEGPAYPAVIEFGPGGGGCPQVAPGGVSAEVNGEPVGGRTVTTAEPVTFSSYVNQADALKVDWDFGDGTSETTSTQFRCPQGLPAQFEEYVRLGLVRQCPSAHHAFAHGGALTVTETIHTDSLATPALTQTTTVNVAGEARVPTAIATGPLEVALGRPATFDGSASFGPGGPNQIHEYHWSFGDGTPEASTTSPTIQHLYGALGLYTVSLTVTDKGGATSAPDTLPNPVAVVQPVVPGEEIVGGTQSGAQPTSASGTGGYLGASPDAKPIPDVRLTKASLTVGTGGTLALTLYCPAEESSCAGQLAVSAVIAGIARGGKKPKAKATTLAKGPFALAGGTPKRVLVRLTPTARAVLQRLHKLTASLTIVAHDPAGAQHTTRLPVVISTAAKRRAH